MGRTGASGGAVGNARRPTSGFKLVLWGSLVTVRAATDIPEDVRVQLEARVANAIAQVQNRRDEFAMERERQTVRRAVEEAQANRPAQEKYREKDFFSKTFSKSLEHGRFPPKIKLAN